MTTDRDFDRIAKAWLADGPDELSVRVLDAVVDDIHVTRQRRALRVPWRLPIMNSPARVATAAVIGVLAVGGVFFIFGRPGQSTVGGPSPSPSTPAIVATPAATTPAASPVPIPALTQTFTSARNGYSVQHPTGWTATPATESWAAGTSTNWGNPALDSIKTSNVRLVVASQQLASGQTADAWLTAYCKSGGKSASSCGPQIKIGSETGYLDADGEPAAGGAIVDGSLIFDAAVVAGGRGYEFTMDGLLDRAYFQALLDTVRFDAASAVGLPILGTTFTSPSYGYSIKTASGWTTKPASKKWVGLDNSPPAVDEIAVTGTDTTVKGASQALPKGTTYAAWLVSLHDFTLTAVPPGCDGGDPSTWPTIQIGKETGRLEMLCNAAEALVQVGGRVYAFDWANATFVGASHLGFSSWRELLKSVTLDPAAAAR